MSIEKGLSATIEAWLAERDATIASLTAQLAAAESGQLLTKAAADGAGSLLLDVQQDCVAATKRANELAALLQEFMANQDRTLCHTCEGCEDDCPAHCWDKRVRAAITSSRGTK